MEQLNLQKYILQLNKDVNPGLQLSAEAVVVMDDMLHDILKKISTNLKELSECTYQKTLTVSLLESSTRLTLPTILDDFAIDYGRNAVSKSLRDMN
ncbi:hypothetical protein AVEN_41762-1 [Araneus ventricosus]|uniref:Uncharacterized protein n=1 Tax=Araneus ventricosus TaxID=182803 RepID=A0A4Y2ADL8_ARAVE|nr:hypothetical protein AVEN_41762-1 [Araneus ventricosus]